jgi:hypothetical protein
VRNGIAPLGLVAVLLAACQRNHFEIEMKADGKVLERTLTCWCDE